MAPPDLAHRRLARQHLLHPVEVEPDEVVRRLGAVQAQDYGGARWGIGQRIPGMTDAAVERAYDAGTIIRTHVLRPTWHLVAPADLRWLLALTAPRVHAANAYRYRQLELDPVTFRRSRAALEKALEGGGELTRAELGQVHERAGIDTTAPQRLAYLLMHAELDGVVCSGARRGKQFTYALVEERVPPAPALERDEALLELAKRYFATRGPATPQDFSWWSGLTVADARRAIQAAGTALEREVIEGRTYWAAGAEPPARRTSPIAHLLPNYDEYFIGLRDRGAVLEVVRATQSDAWAAALFAHVVVVDGQLVGGWKRVLKQHAAVVELNLVARLTKAEQAAVEAAIRRYAGFLELPVEMV
ncbi:MAG TPA: winged helix DNA-binding domain-containing protein [Longimicrobiaceae bacterium]|nr:winged helix DNA-binding domain-containing protein [Longimicrobiaceae bacterium]